MERLSGAAKGLTGPYGFCSAPEQQVCQTGSVGIHCITFPFAGRPKSVLPFLTGS